MSYPLISVVIPVGPGDLAWQGLLPLLTERAEVGEIYLSVSSEADTCEQRLYREAVQSFSKVKMAQGKRGRGRQINRAIAAASHERIWVLHADSRFGPTIWQKTEQAWGKFPGKLHFFALKFAPGDPRLTLNAWGAAWRSCVMGMPFGDQGFMFSKSKWQSVGGFPENCDYGEDHLFVWRWRQQGYQIHGISEALETSGRKYESHGWWQTTLQHGWLTWKQAAPEIAAFWRKKLRKGISCEPKSALRFLSKRRASRH